MRLRVLGSAIFTIALCSCGKTTPTRSNSTEINQSGVALRFRTDAFAGYSVKQEPKLTAQEIGTDIPIDVAPARTVIQFADKRPLPALDKGPRYFLPARSYIALIPLTDKSVTNFQASYPAVYDSAKELQDALKNRPDAFGPKTPLPDLSAIDEAQAIRCKVQYIDLPQLSGVAFVTQYTQEDQGNPVNNEELTYVFQGITKSGSHYIDARFSITHPSLPAGIDDADRITRDKANQYLRNAEKDLNARPDESFSPSLTELKELLSSIALNAN